MRWLHVDLASPAESEARASKLALIDAWWQAFAARRGDIERYIRGDSWDLAGWMREQLAVLDPRLEWEFGLALSRKGHRLVVTPSAEHALYPMVAAMMERAPRIDGWEFYPRHPPSDFDFALKIVAGRAGVDLTGTTVEVVAQPWRRIDLCFFLPRKLRIDEEQEGNVAVVAAQSLLGEQVLHQWIGGLEVRRQGRFQGLSFGAQPRNDMPLQELAPRVQRHVARLLDQRPEQPCLDREEPWKMFETSKDRLPTGTEHARRADMVVGKCFSPEMWATVQGELPFFSESFSRHGEVFGYVKLDGIAGLEGSSFADKGAIEDALDDALREARAGCQIGGGSGLRYAYVDLAFIDVEKGVRIVCDILRRGNVNRRAWVLFFDDVLADEWIGVFPDTPPPPRSGGGPGRVTMSNRIKADARVAN